MYINWQTEGQFANIGGGGCLSLSLFCVLRHMERYFSYICDGTDVQADWRRSCTYGRAPNAKDISQIEKLRPQGMMNSDLES